MTSKRTKEKDKNKSIHKTAKSKPSGTKDKHNQTVKTTNIRKSNNETKNSSKSPQKTEKLPSNTKTKQQSSEKTLIIDDDDLEGMTVPPKPDPPGSPKPQGTEPEAKIGQGPTGPTRGPPRQPPKQAVTPAQKRPPPAKKVTSRGKEESSEDDGDADDEDDSPVKQFSFPAYKILSGASVAPVQMYPQKVVINPNKEGGKRHWGSSLTGLFQNSKLTLKLRMLRLLLIWIFFRVLNKQTTWLSDILGIGVPDEEPAGPKFKPPPGERFIKVFREGDPNPFHVSVKRPL